MTPATRLTRAHREVAKAQRRIARDQAAGRTNRATKRRRLLLNSHSAKLVANARAHKRARTGMPDEVVMHGAQHLDPWRGSRGMVRRRAIPKPAGGERVHYAFGAEGRALQYLVRLALEPGAGTDWNVSAAGRGKDEMVRDVAARIKDKKWWVVADIRGAYDAMADPDGVAALLPLPKKVTENVILGRNLRVAGNKSPRNRCPYGRPIKRRENGDVPSRIYDGSLHYHPYVSRARAADSQPLANDSNPPGVVQGSACSDLAMVWLLMPVADQIGPCLIYGDDVIVPADSEDEARGIARTLAAVLSAHRAGNISLKHCSVHHRDQGIFVCGYWIRWRRSGAVVTPYPDVINLWIVRLYSAFYDDWFAGMPWPPKRLTSFRLARSMLAGYPAWPQGDKFAAAILRRCFRAFFAWLRYTGRSS